MYLGRASRLIRLRTADWRGMFDGSLSDAVIAHGYRCPVIRAVTDDWGIGHADLEGLNASAGGASALREYQ